MLCCNVAFADMIQGGNCMLYLSFDAESDGLYGPCFAIGAVVMSEAGETIDMFSGIACAESVRDPWVKQNCLPLLQDLPVYPSREELHEGFWSFCMKYSETALFVADVPVPVEAGLLRICVEYDLPERNFLAPYPLIDVASVLFAAGIDPNTDRQQLAGWEGRRHHPMDDAICSLKAMLTVLHGSAKNTD